MLLIGKLHTVDDAIHGISVEIQLTASSNCGGEFDFVIGTLVHFGTYP